MSSRSNVQPLSPHLLPSGDLRTETDSLSQRRDETPQSAILDLITRLMRDQGIDAVRASAASLIADYLQADYVAIGGNPISNTPSPVAVIAGKKQPTSQARNDLEAALGECVVTARIHATPLPHSPPAPHTHGRSFTNPIVNEELPPGNSLRYLANQSVSPTSLIAIPLLTDDDRCAGAILVAWSSTSQGFMATRSHLAFLKQAALPLAELFCTVERSTPNAMIRRWNTLRQSFNESTSRSWFIAAVVLLLVGFIPYQYPVSAAVSVQPNVRRWIVAPFDAPLEKVHVIPGQSVKAGDLLFTIDCEDTLDKLVSLRAESERSVAERAAHLSSTRLSDASLAGWNIKRIAGELERLEKHLERATVRSPIDGVVLGDDMQRLEGSPLKAGQALVEVARIDELHIDIEIPTDQIVHVSLGNKLTAKIDAAGSMGELSLSRIHPRAEPNDEGVYAFRGRSELSQPNEHIKPGMRGRATIHGEYRPLVWCMWVSLWQRIRDWS